MVRMKATIEAIAVGGPAVEDVEGARMERGDVASDVGMVGGIAACGFELGRQPESVRVFKRWEGEKVKARQTQLLTGLGANKDQRDLFDADGDKSRDDDQEGQQPATIGRTCPPETMAYYPGAATRQAMSLADGNWKPEEIDQDDDEAGDDYQADDNGPDAGDEWDGDESNQIDDEEEYAARLEMMGEEF